MSRNKTKGTRFETEVVTYLNENGFPYAERRALNGKNDRGDVNFHPDWVLELKNHKEISLAGFVDEAMVEKANANALYGAAVVKRPRKNVSEAYVIMPLAQFVELLQH